ncbi:MAG: hypothetical protein HHAS10_10180 [Candidatus Altimarinota bacterium]
MYISVIPTSKSQGKSPYIYFVSPTWENQITIGGLVEIPFGKEILFGIVTSFEIAGSLDINTYEIRPIHSVICSSPILDIQQLKVILRLSEKYFLPIHKSLSLFLPIALLRRLEKRNFILSDTPRNKGEVFSSISIHHYIESTFSPKDIKEYLKPESVILFPDDMMLFSFFKGKINDDSISLIPTEATITKRIQAWIDIYEKKYEIIVGTRRLLYYNLKAYKNIIYIEDAFGVEQFQYPTSIRSLDVLSFILESHSHNITIISSSPSLELFAKFPKSKIQTMK